jgi:aspartate/methionine/tyrosine aminotransferase
VDISFSSRIGWPAPDNSLAALRSRRREEGLPILDFSESNPTRVGLTLPRLDSLLDPENSNYEPNPKGMPRAREALAADYARRLGNNAPGPDDLFLCASTSEAYSWLFKLLCDPGDAILVPKPGYPLFDYLAGLEAVEARPYRLDYVHPIGWRIDLDSVREALVGGRAKALVAINPNNPTGSYIGGEEREALLALCRSHACAIIADEVFFGFPVERAAEGEGASSFVGEGGQLCFVLDGLSKRLGMPQAKLGWIAASGPRPELDEARDRLDIIADAYLSAGTPVMNALPSLLSGAEAFAMPCRERLAVNIACLRRLLEGPDSPHRLLRCEGGWTAIIESPRLLPEEELALGLLREKGLWTHPGYFFDMEREAFFTVGLILPPEDLERGALAFADYFAGLQG